MRTFRENIERVSTFYNSDYYKTLQATNPRIIRNICEALMEDPDAVDSELLAEKVSQLSGLTAKKYTAIDGDVVLGLDCVTGWKALFDFHNGDRAWIDDYAIIRKSLNAHMLWPKHGNNTINTVRYRAFRDRVDYTLYDIKRFYERDSNLRLQVAYDDPVTHDWLMKFGSFENLVDCMKLNCFCTENNDIISLCNTSSIITDYDNNIKTIDRTYIENLKSIVS